MRTEKEIRKRIDELFKLRNIAIENWCTDDVIDEYDAQILTLRWVLGE